MHKRHVFAAIALSLLLFAIPAVTAEQLTTVAVFDMDQVLVGFYTESDLFRDYDRALEQYRSDLLVAENDLRTLRAQRATAIQRNQSRTAANLREEIADQEEYIIALNERWYQTEDELLEELQDDVFYRNLNEVAGYVGEENGYSLIMDVSRTGTGIFWYSQTIDITDDIIRELLTRYR